MDPNSAVRVRALQVYRNIDMTRERIGLIFELMEMFLSFQTQHWEMSFSDWKLIIPSNAYVSISSHKKSFYVGGVLIGPTPITSPS